MNNKMGFLGWLMGFCRWAGLFLVNPEIKEQFFHFCNNIYIVFICLLMYYHVITTFIMNIVVLINNYNECCI